MSALITWLSGFGVWFGSQIAAKWGYKLALLAVVTSTFAAMWTASIAALEAVAALLPDSGFTPFLLQFFPSSVAISTATTAYYGSMLVKKSFDWWRMSFGIAAKIGAV